MIFDASETYVSENPCRPLLTRCCSAVARKPIQRRVRDTPCTVSLRRYIFGPPSQRILETGNREQLI